MFSIVSAEANRYEAGEISKVQGVGDLAEVCKLAGGIATVGLVVGGKERGTFLVSAMESIRVIKEVF